MKSITPTHQSRRTFLSAGPAAAAMLAVSPSETLAVEPAAAIHPTLVRLIQEAPLDTQARAVIGVGAALGIDPIDYLTPQQLTAFRTDNTPIANPDAARANASWIRVERTLASGKLVHERFIAPAPRATEWTADECGRALRAVFAHYGVTWAAVRGTFFRSAKWQSVSFSGTAADVRLQMDISAALAAALIDRDGHLCTVSPGYPWEPDIASWTSTGPHTLAIRHDRPALLEPHASVNVDSPEPLDALTVDTAVSVLATAIRTINPAAETLQVTISRYNERHNLGTKRRPRWISEPRCRVSGWCGDVSVWLEGAPARLAREAFLAWENSHTKDITVWAADAETGEAVNAVDAPIVSDQQGQEDAQRPSVG